MPGEVYEVDIEIWATCVVLPPRFRLALSILAVTSIMGWSWLISTEP